MRRISYQVTFMVYIVYVAMAMPVSKCSQRSICISSSALQSSAANDVPSDQRSSLSSTSTASKGVASQVISVSTEINNTSNSNTDNTRIKSEKLNGNTRRAPRVDSQLLRYVATATNATPTSGVKEEVINGGLSEETSSDTPEASALAFSTGNSVSSDLCNLDNAQGNLSPFRRLNKLVFSTLTQHGAGVEEAQWAANAVEAHTLERFRRRQLRLYMKARDDSWSSFFQNEATYALDMCSEEQSNLLLQQDFVSAAGFKNERIDNVLKQLFDAGLTGKDCAAVLTHTPSLALSKDGNVKEGVDYAMALLCNNLGLRRYDARKVIRACPGLLTAQGANSAAQIVDMLSSLGVSRSSLARDKARLPLMLSRQPGSLFRLAAFLASNLIRLPTDRVGPLLRRPECLPLLDSVVPLEYVLKLQASKQIDGAILSQMIREEIDEKYRIMKTSAELLRDEFGIEDMAQLIAAFPGVLLLDSAKQIAPIVLFLSKEVGIDEDDVQKVLQSFPSLLEADLNTMRKTICFLESVDVSTDDIPKIIRAFPSILLLDIDVKMRPVVTFLEEIGVVNIGRFITRLPPVLGYSVEQELRPKWKYLIKSGFDYFDVVRFPAYFSYPFERVIKSRFEYLSINNIPPKAIGLDRILRFGDEDFIKIISNDTKTLDDYRKFSRQRQTCQSERIVRIRKKIRQEDFQSTSTRLQTDEESMPSIDSCILEVDGQLVDLSQSRFNDDNDVPISSRQ